MVRPVATLLAPTTVAVYRVDAFRPVPAVSANVAILLEASIETEPVGVVQGAAQLSVKLALPSGIPTGSLNAAVTRFVLMATPVALLVGVTAVMVGAKMTPVPPVPPAAVTPAPSIPKIGSRPPPPPPPQPATMRVNIHAASHGLTPQEPLMKVILLSLV